MSPLRIIIITLFLSVPISTLISYACFSPPPPVVQMDMKKAVDSFKNDIASHNLEPAMLKVQVKLFTTSLEAVLKTYSETHNVVIAVSPAIISGAPDITYEIQRQTFELMKNDSRL